MPVRPFLRRTSTNDREQRNVEHEQFDFLNFEFEQLGHDLGNEHHEHDQLE